MSIVVMPMMVPNLVAPVVGTAIKSLAVGSIVKLKESGTAATFFVAKHDYEASLNGQGRTLLVREHALSNEQAWDNKIGAEYARSELDRFLREYYVNSLDYAIRAVLGTKIHSSSSGYSPAEITVINRPAFQLSMMELGKGNFDPPPFIPKEGEPLPIADRLLVATTGSTAVNQWTRTPAASYATPNRVYGLDASGKSVVSTVQDRGIYPRPCITLPGNMLVDANGNVIGG